MRNQAIAVLVAAACVGGCTTTGSTPATAPEATAPAPITTEATSTSADTTVPDTTTTTTDRLTEIQAIFDDLEYRRLLAIEAGDQSAFESLFANENYLAESLVTLELVEVINPSAVETIDFTLLSESDSCIAAEMERSYAEAIEGGGTVARVYVIERRADGSWGLSWIGEGWSCAGPHPLDS